MDDGNKVALRPVQGVTLTDEDLRRIIGYIDGTSPGDINGDGKVDVSDYIGVANHIHGKTPEGFNAAAADVDKSGSIDVSDYIGIANIIHTGSPFGNGK